MIKSALILLSLCLTAYCQESSILTAIEQTTGWTAEELTRGLEMLDRVYSNDCRTVSGRQRWHGKVVSSAVDTNALMKIQTYEDGFVWKEPFRPVRNRPIEAKLSAEEIARRSEEARQAKAAEERAKKAARLEFLLANEESEIARISAKYPPLLAGLLYTNEVHNLQTELGVPVTATIEPQNGGAE